MVAKFEVFKNKSGKYRWRLHHENGNVIAYSGEGHVIKANATDGIESLKKDIASASIKDLTPPQPTLPSTPTSTPIATAAETANQQSVTPSQSMGELPLTMEKVAPLSPSEEKDFPTLTIALLAAVWYVVSIAIILA